MSAREVQPLSAERLAEIREHVAGIRNWSLGNLAARDLLAEVDRLLAERHETNEALDDAVQELRARQVSDAARSADKLSRLLAPVQALRERPGEFEATLRHPYRLGHDLPETDGAK